MKLVLEKLTKTFPGRKVFKDVSIEVDKGKTLVITGPNGSGKTTMMKIISSLMPATSGKVIFQNNGSSFSGVEILPFIGFVAPDLFLYDELTALENLTFFASVSGITGVDFESKLTEFGLKGRSGDLVRSYSSGMKQRLKYVLATMKSPQILMLDEPTANLDEDGKMMVDRVIKNHHGITVIATNEEKELEYGDSIYRLN